MSEKRVVVVWPENVCDYEQDFIKELLCAQDSFTIEIEIEIVKDTPSDHRTRCIYVVNYWTDHVKYGEMYNNPYGLLYLGDECLSHRMDQYLNDDKCMFIWRQYVHPRYFNHPKVFQLPCAYKKGFSTNVQENHGSKDLMWSFAGAYHANRRAALDALASVTPNYVHKMPPDSFNHSDGLSTEMYRKLCTRSNYVMCPTGKWSMECSRLYECLEAGSIPITIANSTQIEVNPSYHHAVFPHESHVGTIPFFIGQTWQDCVEFMENNRDPVELTHKCQAYWKRCKAFWNTRLHQHAVALTLV